jgi:hypothetical protein
MCGAPGKQSVHSCRIKPQHLGVIADRLPAREKIDNKTISKWSRALRYVAKFKKGAPLKTFIAHIGH